jgi:hypothetical protein
MPALKKTTVVKEHKRRVSASTKNPSGSTLVDRHLRRLPGTFLDPETILEIVKAYNTKGLNFPTAHALGCPDGNKYDKQIAIWTDYFAKKFKDEPAIHPNIIKALIGSESSFEVDPPGNKVALGIAQITKQTFKVLQAADGEAKEFIFKGVRQKDLKNPDVAIPMGVRWLYVKQKLAKHKLGYWPSPEELILEYKGMLKSNTPLKDKALKNFREKYATLQK